MLTEYMRHSFLLLTESLVVLFILAACTRIWEGTMSDVNFDPSICRNIMVDSRYVLFIIDKFAGQRWLIDEMELVR